eukprot:gene2319-2787_t
MSNKDFEINKWKIEYNYPMITQQDLQFVLETNRNNLMNCTKEFIKLVTSDQILNAIPNEILAILHFFNNDGIETLSVMFFLRCVLRYLSNKTFNKSQNKIGMKKFKRGALYIFQSFQMIVNHCTFSIKQEEMRFMNITLNEFENVFDNFMKKVLALGYIKKENYEKIPMKNIENFILELMNEGIDFSVLLEDGFDIFDFLVKIHFTQKTRHQFLDLAFNFR